MVCYNLMYVDPGGRNIIITLTPSLCLKMHEVIRFEDVTYLAGKVLPQMHASYSMHCPNPMDWLCHQVINGRNRNCDSYHLCSTWKILLPTSMEIGRYYLVDTRFRKTHGFLAPFRAMRYHLREHRGRTPRNPKELFNKRHFQAHNVIERAFGLLKNHFSILKTAPWYDFSVQVSIVLISCILHNFIVDQNHDMEDEKSTIIEKIWHDELEDDLTQAYEDKNN